jgi:hypothetical protein
MPIYIVTLSNGVTLEIEAATAVKAAQRLEAIRAGLSQTVLRLHVQQDAPATGARA